MEDARTKLDWFHTVILPHQDALRGRLSRILHSGLELDDFVSEVLTRAYANDRWQEVRHGRAFLFTIARNLTIDEARRRKVVAFDVIADADALEAPCDFESQMSAREELRWLQSALMELPAQCRRVFQLRRVQEKSMREIAEMMGLSVSTVEKHLSKAVRMITRARTQRGEFALEQEQSDTVGRKDAGSQGGDACRPLC